MFLGAAGRGFSRLKWLTKAEPWLLRRGFSVEATVADSSGDEVAVSIGNQVTGNWRMTESAEAVPGFQDLWSKLKDSMEVEKTAQEWKNQGNPLSKELIDSALLKFCSNGHFSRAQKLVKWVNREKIFEFNERDKLMMLAIAGHLKGSASQVTKILGTLELKTELPYILALKIYTGEMLEKQAEKLFTELKASNCMTTAQGYTLMLRMYVKGKNKEKALKIFKEYEASKLPRDPAMYWFILSNKKPIFDSVKVEAKARAALRELQITALNRRDLMRYYATLKDSEGFSRVWEHVVNNPPVLPDDYVGAISCCSIIGDVEKAEEISSQFGGEKLSYNHGLALLRLYAMHGKMDKALEMQKELLQQTLDFELFHPIIDGYLKEGKVDMAADCFHSFMGREGKAHIAWRLVLDSIVKLNDEYALTGDVERAEKLMIELPDKNAEPAFESLMRVYVAAGLPTDKVKERMAAYKQVQDEERLTARKRGNPSARKRGDSNAAVSN